VIDTSGRVVHEVVLPQPREHVFDFFVDPTRLVRWLGVNAELDAKPGGVFRFEVAPGHFCEGAYVSVERPSRVAFTWGWTDPWWGVPPGESLVEIELTELEGGATKVTVVHSGLPTSVRPLHDEGWSTFLQRLNDVTCGRDPGGYPDADPVERKRVLDQEKAR
jgi:uncharacterized protein YndB with AHSA1/START domain